MLGRLVELEPAPADLLGRIVTGPTITVADLSQAGAVPAEDSPARQAAGSGRAGTAEQGTLL